MSTHPETTRIRAARLVHEAASQLAAAERLLDAAQIGERGTGARASLAQMIFRSAAVAQEIVQEPAMESREDESGPISPPTSKRRITVRR